MERATGDFLHFTGLGAIPLRVSVTIEVPRGSHVKRGRQGRVEFIAPLPCPYNYGSIEGTLAEDGDPLDALVLGPPVARGTRLRARVQAVMGFVDAGRADPKVVCSESALTWAERRKVERFFAVYALFKRGLHRISGRPGRTARTGWLPRTPGGGDPADWPGAC